MTDLALPGWRGGDGNAAYLDKTLRFGPVEEWLADDGVAGSLWKIFKRATLISILVWLPFLPAIATSIGDSSSSISANTYSSYNSYGSSQGDGSGAAIAAIVISGLVFWAILLFSRQLEPIAEWRVLLADRSDRVEAVYRQVAGTLQDRKLPIGWKARRIRTDLGVRNVSSRLVLTDRPCTAIVSVFPYGTSLYLGWTMWRSRRGYALIGRFFADLLLSMVGGNEPEQVMLRTERLRAMREAVHAACREGLVVAVEGRDVADWVGFPEGLPPIDERRISGPPPGTPRPWESAPRPGQVGSGPAGGPPPPSASRHRQGPAPAWPHGAAQPAQPARPPVEPPPGVGVPPPVPGADGSWWTPGQQAGGNPSGYRP